MSGTDGLIGAMPWRRAFDGGDIGCSSAAVDLLPAVWRASAGLDMPFLPEIGQECITIFHYQPWGWVVTGSLTALACLAVDHVFRWESHRRKMLEVVTNPKVWRVDCFLLVVGAAFMALALLVY